MIILACGEGKRMGSDIPKQFMCVAGKPLILHTAERIHAFDSSYNIIIVINQNHRDIWDSITEKHNFRVPVTLVYGGKERFYSVRNGLQQVKEDSAIVAVHDGVRPFVTKQMFEDSFVSAEKYGNGVCAVKSSDSVRIGAVDDNKSTERNNVFLMQTPQTFRADILKKAYNQPYNEKFTDDASVAEATGEKIYITQGGRENIKITYPFDLLLAEQILKQQNI
ncbi:MAG: 2-C-methyl-D-erythritol 4-phosphate cytidylyltransferase [Bacteroidales bacterium]|nr:2-C-methyl-D-erythritol 4-phosphate cytidylyltransferase [Bacteroidales bacterium]